MKNNNQTEESVAALTIYRDIVVSTNTLIWRTDGEGRFTYLNPAWGQSCGYALEEMLGRPFSEFQVPEAAEHYINAFRNCLIGEPIIGHETTYFSKNGEEVHLAINMVPVYDNKGDIVGTQGTAYDVTERRHADELLQYLSAKDELTGLYNLHTFLSMTEQQIKTAGRDKKKLMIIYAGIDGMQAVNEEHGQISGDQLIIVTANILRKTFREADILARTGGDEFVISTLVLSKDTEKMIMDRLNENLDAYNVDQDDSLKIELSYGTAFYHPGKSVSFNDVLSYADEKMYEHKQSKNRGL
jgi:diguanylate cyclase (GGDEF)-like protein/PAS domain S-box-containing protein